jgi:hypothetical protein
MNRHDREHFERLQALPARTETQQRLLDSMLRWDELEAHHDNREREWHAQHDRPAGDPPVNSSGDYTGRYASNGSYAEALAHIDDVLADTGWQPPTQAAAEGWAR